MKQIKNPVGDGGDRIPRLKMARDFGFLILNVVLDVGGLPHAMGSVTAVFNGVPSCYYLCRRFRRVAAAPPSIHLVALTGSKIWRTCGSREDNSLFAYAANSKIAFCTAKQVSPVMVAGRMANQKPPGRESARAIEGFCRGYGDEGQISLPI